MFIIVKVVILYNIILTTIEKCCIVNCNSGYSSNKKTVFKFSAPKDLNKIIRIRNKLWSLILVNFKSSHFIIKLTKKIG